MASLFEKYRPATWEQVIGQDKAIGVLKRVSPGGRAFWFAGPSGVGKTTMARLLASSFADSWAIDEIDAQDCTLDYLRSIEAAFPFRALGERTGKAWIVNEAHGLRGPILSRFLTLIEALPEHCLLAFTTTFAGQQSLFSDYEDASPLLSRCLAVPVAWHEYAPNQVGPITTAFAKRAMEIARAENLDGQPLAAYEKLALACKHNLRLMLSKIEAGAMLR